MTNEQIRAKWGDKVKWVERPRKYRYVYFNANKRRKKQLLSELRYPILPYPKGSGTVDTVNVAVPEVLINQQMTLF
jgi:hypothetical protein